MDDLGRLVGSFARAVLGKPFFWGEMDCNVLVLKWAETVSGEPVGADVCGAYADEAEAREFASGYGRGLGDLLEDAGFQVFDTPVPRAGDVVLADIPGEPFTRSHVAVGSGRFLSANPQRGVFVDRLARLAEFAVMRHAHV